MTELSSGYMAADGHRKHCKMKNMDSEAKFGEGKKRKYDSEALNHLSNKETNISLHFYCLQRSLNTTIQPT